MKCLSILALLVLIGCATPPPIMRTVVIKNLKVTLTNAELKVKGKSVIGFYRPKTKEIFVKSYWQNGKIVPYIDCLGFEFLNHLSHIDSDIINGHELR